MRKLFLPALVLAALIAACENKTPNGPDGVGPGGVTVSLTTTTTTTSTSTTTTTVPGKTAPGPTTTSVTRVAFAPLCDVQRAAERPVGHDPFLPAPHHRPDAIVFAGRTVAVRRRSNRDRHWESGPRSPACTSRPTTTRRGTSRGNIFGPSDPLTNGGEFHGVLRTTISGCTAERAFRGPMGPTSMNLQGGETIRDCAGSPLSFSSVNMTQSNSPPPPPATTSTSTTPRRPRTTTRRSPARSRSRRQRLQTSRPRQTHCSIRHGHRVGRDVYVDRAGSDALPPR